MKFLLRHWFLIALTVVLSVGFTWPLQVEPLADAIPQSWLIAAVMFLMALPMPFAQLSGSIRNSGPAWLAIGINSGVAPLLGWGVGMLLPPALAVGMVIATAVPCTMASAAVWTRRGGGNDAVVLLVTIVTSLACFLILPAWLMLLLRTEVTLDFSELSLNLLLRVVLPIIAAQLVRRIGAVGAWATAYRVPLSIVSQLGILLMLLAGAVTSNHALASSDSDTPTALQWGFLILVVVGVHCLLLAIGWWLSRLAGYPYAEKLAVSIAGSQKTLPVGLEVASKFGGLAVLPMVVYHVSQLLIDTVLIERLRSQHLAADTSKPDVLPNREL